MPTHDRSLTLLLPWGVTILFALAYVQLLLPRTRDGGIGVFVAVVAGLALVSFALAAVTFTIDVLHGRDPTA